MAAVPACCREFEDPPVDPRLLLESLLSKLFPFLKDLFIVSASSSAAAALLLLPLPSTATKRPSNPRLSPRPPSESSHFHFHRGSGDHSPLRRTRARRTWRTRRDWARQTAMNTSNDAQKTRHNRCPSRISNTLPGFSRPQGRSAVSSMQYSLGYHRDRRGRHRHSLPSFLSITTRRLSYRRRRPKEEEAAAGPLSLSPLSLHS